MERIIILCLDCGIYCLKFGLSLEDLKEDSKIHSDCRTDSVSKPDSDSKIHPTIFCCCFPCPQGDSDSESSFDSKSDFEFYSDGKTDNTNDSDSKTDSSPDSHGV